MGITAFWFRRDLRLVDNTALNRALETGNEVLPVFIFDVTITKELPVDDPRITFIYKRLMVLNEALRTLGSGLLVVKGEPLEVWTQLIGEYNVSEVYVNRDYEPYANARDKQLEDCFLARGVKLLSFKDQVVFEKDEVVKRDGQPYTIFTPYKKQWLSVFDFNEHLPVSVSHTPCLLPISTPLPSMEELGFQVSIIEVRDWDFQILDRYAEGRDYPAEEVTSYLGPHLRFGTISIRQVIKQIGDTNEVFFSQLIWREFFMQILVHFPQVVSRNFKKKYDGVRWRNNEAEFDLWCRGETGYALVDAGMRQLNATGYMHNRVRMVTAGFLCKHLLIDWRWGEAYFATKLLDYELAANNGNWQWAAGTGCDAAPYFRIFNPINQLKRFDKELVYVKKWVPEYGTSAYVLPVVEHAFARQRALETYGKVR